MSQPGVDSSNKLRVLIVDDFQETRRSVRLMLSMNPGVVVIATASNGRQAIDLAKTHHPDIVVMDINMPEMDGLAAFKAISEIYPDTGCIIISAQTDLQTLNAAITLGVQEYLGKPFSIEELNDAINRVGKLVIKNRPKLEHASHLRKQSENSLEQLANEYAKAKRTDDQALSIFEQLAENQNCELRWLRTLAMLYIIRQEWGKLKALAARLEKQAKDHPFK
jgi:YesN/AraC family two-component response regulator